MTSKRFSDIDGKCKNDHKHALARNVCATIYVRGEHGTAATAAAASVGQAVCCHSSPATAAALLPPKPSHT